MKIVSGLRVKLFFFKLNLKLVLFLIQKYGIGKQFKDKKAEIERFKEQFTINKSFYKYLRHNNRVYLNCNIPGIPFTDFFERISNLASENQENQLSRLAIVQIGFTKKCPLNCEHCYEGKILNQPEAITLEEHIQIVAKLQQIGVPMIQFSFSCRLQRK